MRQLILDSLQRIENDKKDGENEDQFLYIYMETIKDIIRFVVLQYFMIIKI